MRQNDLFIWRRTKLTKKHLSYIIGGLILVNLITVGLLLIKSKSSLGSAKESVATIGKDKVTRIEWYQHLERQYGEEVLKKLIDEKVIMQLAKKHNVEISDDYLETELTILKSLYHINSDNDYNGDNWKEQLRLSMLLEELLTLDVVIPDDELEKYYEENISQYMINPAYNISHIIVQKEEDAKQVYEQLQNGANFSILAMEVSIDEFTANEGGEIGFINEDDERFTNDYIAEVKNLNIGEWSNPIKVNNGFAIVQLNDRIDGKDYSFNDVKKQIRRKIALEQMDIPVSTHPLWEELQVDWVYKDEK